MVKFKKLGDLCYISSGGTPKRTITDYWDNGKIPWVKISDIKSKHILNTDERITKQGLENSSAKLFPKDTIVYTIFATVGEVGILDITAATNQAIAGIQVKDRTQLRVDYLYYFLKSIKKSVQFLGRGVAQNNINLSVLKSISVPIPSFQEQTAIVKVLDSLNGQIKNKHKQLTLLSQLIKARFVEMFGDIKNNQKYNYKQISSFTNVVSGGTPKRDVKEYWDNGTIPWVKTTELKNKKVNSTEEYITKSGLQNSSAKLVPAHTILIAMYGQGKTRGMTAYLEKEAATNQACACILPSSNINSEYLWQYLIMSYNELRNMAKGGNQPNLNSRIIKNFPVLYPPVSLQNKFASFVQQVDKSKVVIQKSLDETQTLFDSLMQKYFS